MIETFLSPAAFLAAETALATPSVTNATRTYDNLENWDGPAFGNVTPKLD